MLSTRLISISPALIMLLVFCTAMEFNSAAFAWGHDGHGAVGILAVERLQTDTRVELDLILGSVDDQTIIEACNWPDTVRETHEWSWSYPLHYINIPVGELSYVKSRDCPDQLCATEAIKKYAGQLGDRQANEQTRRQAFAWLCHLTGDLHQPLHAGFAHDRGGNDFEITFTGEAMNLHDFWDRALIKQRAGDWRQLIRVINKFPTVATADNWSPVIVDRWTEESHLLVQQEIYPEERDLTESYQQKSWQILQQRINTAASRLASIINTVL